MITAAIISVIIFAVITGFIGYSYISYLNHKDEREHQKHVAEAERKRLEEFNKLPRKIRRMGVKTAEKRNGANSSRTKVRS